MRITDIRLCDALEGHMHHDELAALYDLASEVDEGAIVEIGSFRGQSTCALALGSKAGHGAPVYAVDPHELHRDGYGGRYGPDDWAPFYRALIGADVADIVRPVGLASDRVLDRLPAAGLVFIDAEHTYEATRKQALEVGRTESAVVVLDDCHEEGVQRVVQDLAAAGYTIEYIPMKVAICRR